MPASVPQSEIRIEDGRVVEIIEWGTIDGNPLTYIQARRFEHLFFASVCEFSGEYELRDPNELSATYSHVRELFERTDLTRENLGEYFKDFRIITRERGLLIAS